MKYLQSTLVISVLIGTMHTVSAQSLLSPRKIYHSADQGESWQPADKGFPQTAVVNDLAFHNGIYFAGTEAHGLYVSKDHLRSWTKVGAGLPKDIKIDAIAGMDKVLALGSNQHGIYLSTDNGTSWHAGNNGLTNLTVRCLYMQRTFMLAGTNDGIFISRNSGQSWKQVFAGKQINGFTGLNGKIYAGITSGVLLSVDNGDKWRSIYDGHTLHNIANDGEYVFALCYGPVVLRTKDDGAHWIQSDAGLPNLYTFHVKRTGKRLIACQWDGMYKSDNNGNSWEKSSNGLPHKMAFKELLVTTDGVVTAGP